MAYELDLPKRLKMRGWKVKIRDRERLEPPHATIFLRARKWRVSLRDRSFLAPGGSWNDIDDEVRDAIRRRWDELREAWDRMYPDNPVSSAVEDDDA